MLAGCISALREFELQVKDGLDAVEAARAVGKGSAKSTLVVKNAQMNMKKTQDFVQELRIDIQLMEGLQRTLEGFEI